MRRLRFVTLVRVGVTLVRVGVTLVRVGVTLVLVAVALACATRPAERVSDREGPSELDGLTLVYAFPNGRTYRAAYGPSSVDFRLLAPLRAEMPGATIPYRAERLRPDLFLVVWEAPPFHTTFTIDLAARRLYASAWRDGRAFLGTAEILEVHARGTPPGSLGAPER